MLNGGEKKMKNQKQTEKQLTWEYFWGQKREELWAMLKVALVVISILMGMVFIPYLIAVFINNLFLDYDIPIELLWAIGALILTFGYAFTHPLIYWVKSNWKRAKQRAKVEMKRRKGK